MKIYKKDWRTSMIKPKKTRKKYNNPEKQIENSIISWLKANGAYVVKIQSGVIKIGERFIHMAPKGTPDLFFVIKNRTGFGVPCFCEVKKDQKEVQRWINVIEKFKGGISGAIPFAEYDGYIKDREELQKKYETILRWIGDISEEQEVAKAVNPSDDVIERLVPRVEEERVLATELGLQKNAIQNLEALLQNSEFMTDEEIAEANKGKQSMAKRKEGGAGT